MDYEMEELIPLVKELCDRYTGKESTSVTLSLIHILAGEPGQSEWQREPFYTNAETVADIIKCADELGKMYKMQ